MPLGKSPLLAPAFLAAHRRNAQKSTGPRTPPRGESQPIPPPVTSDPCPVTSKNKHRLLRKMLELGEQGKAWSRLNRLKAGSADHRPSVSRPVSRRGDGWPASFLLRRERSNSIAGADGQEVILITNQFMEVEEASKKRQWVGLPQKVLKTKGGVKQVRGVGCQGPGDGRLGGQQKTPIGGITPEVVENKERVKTGVRRRVSDARRG